VYLRSISIRGFKSFPDPVEIRLEPGVAVVVGPNGSGKSNIADALLWAAGSLAPSELRAERPDDVLFAGSSTRPPAAFCEVELRFEEVDGALTGLDYSEVVVARRLHRSGESRYLVNGVSVRRADVVELLAEVGLGPGGGAVVGQGKVEAILASSPAERRALVEEAAGLGRFKRRRHRAELKLARVAQQVERARDLEAEAQRRLRPLALQASAAERAEKLSAAIRRLQAGLASLDLAELAGRLEAAERERAEAARARRQAEERLQAVLAERGRAEEELAHVAGGREGAAALLYRLRSAAERVGLRREAATELAERARRPAAPGDGDDLAERIRLLESRAAAVEQALAEREGLPPAARVLAEQGERLLLSLLHVQPGRERAVAAALRQRASALVADSPEEALALARRAREEGLGSLVVLVHDNPAELVDELPLVDLEGLLASPVPAVTVEGFGYDPEQRELWFAGETAEAFHLELAAQARRLRAEAAQLRAGLPASAPHVTDPRLLELSTRLQRELTRALAAAERLEGPLRLRAEREGEAARELAGALRRLAAEEAELRRLATEAAARATAAEVELARLEGEASAARRRLQEAAAEPAQGERGQLEEELRRLERRREALGAVNPFAQEEYGREKARLDHLREQRADLERSLQELEALRRELDETVERRFAETFARVRENFAQVAATLFPGGQGQLRLSEPQGEEKEPGIEVELRPAGKRVTRLSLLSGGEKALGAIAFLFALFLARPCPFYLLDEVEAALDDTNIGRFVELLRRFADRAQFIVVTHQKRTMEAADVLYGVSMGADGVSQVVSRRLPREEAPTAA
jgi:chromosome segregation protein